MKELTHLTWDNFESSIIVEGENRVHRVSDAPRVEIFSDGERGRIGLWLHVAEEEPIPESLKKMSLLSFTYCQKEGEIGIETAIQNQALFRHFYAFALAVADRVLLEEIPPVAALGVEVGNLADLLESRKVLSPERQRGLLGELLVLERVLSSEGIAGLHAWVGPMGEPHDFRICDTEFEVKSTIRTRRIHTINSVQQLLPSEGYDLYVISILLAPPGKDVGFSLVEKVSQLRARVSADQWARERLEQSLNDVGYDTSEEQFYDQKYLLRRPMAVCQVNAPLPALTPQSLSMAVGTAYGRIEELHYDVNLEGIEHEEPTKEFVKAFPY